jgi:hypothetical protein
VEFVSFPGLDHPPQYGRAYGEFKLIDHVMAHSRLIREAPTAKVWKITGRYRIVNLRQLIRRAPRHYDLYCNIRNWPSRWVDLGLIAWSAAGYDATLRGVYPELREDLLVDHAPEVRMRSLIDRLDGRARIVRRYTVEPRIDGIRGWDGRPYAHGLNGVKFHVRRVARRVAPWIWI